MAEVSVALPGSDGKVRDVTLRYKVQDDDSKYMGSKDMLINRSAHRLFFYLYLSKNFKFSAAECIAICDNRYDNIFS